MNKNNLIELIALFFLNLFFFLYLGEKKKRRQIEKLLNDLLHLLNKKK